jgi:hypothetical protein
MTFVKAVAVEYELESVVEEYSPPGNLRPASSGSILL